VSDTMTAREVAEGLGVSLPRAYAILASGRIKSRREGGRILVSAASFGLYRRRRERDPKSKPARWRDLAIGSYTLYRSGDYTQAEVARLYGCSVPTMRLAWRANPDVVPPDEHRAIALARVRAACAKMTPQRVAELRRLGQGGLSAGVLAYKFGIARRTAAYILSERLWPSEEMDHAPL
jgi:excisionase family DNA binding protein